MTTQERVTLVDYSIIYQNGGWKNDYAILVDGFEVFRCPSMYACMCYQSTLVNGGHFRIDTALELARERAAMAATAFEM